MHMVRGDCDTGGLGDFLCDVRMGALSDPALSIATAFIAEHEGFRSHPYADVGGTFTIGYGFTYLPDGKKVTPDTPPVDQSEAYQRLTVMVARVLVAVRVIAPTNITTNQAAALCSFAYNEGTGALRHSTLLELLNKGDVCGAAEQFAAWIYAGGGVSQGLIARRAAERALFLTPDEALVIPDPDHSADALMEDELNPAPGDSLASQET